MFVRCYLFMGVARPVFMMVAFRGQQLAHNYRMLLIWTLVAGVFWVAGALLEPQWRLLIWVVAVIIDYPAPMVHYRVPGVGTAPMDAWDTDPGHLAERNRLVFIIALGESILLMGGVIVDHGDLTAALAVSLLGRLRVPVRPLVELLRPHGATRGGDGSTRRAAIRIRLCATRSWCSGAILVAVSIELRLSHDHLTPFRS